MLSSKQTPATFSCSPSRSPRKGPHATASVTGVDEHQHNISSSGVLRLYACHINTRACARPHARNSPMSLSASAAPITPETAADTRAHVGKQRMCHDPVTAAPPRSCTRSRKPPRWQCAPCLHDGWKPSASLENGTYVAILGRAVKREVAKRPTYKGRTRGLIRVVRRMRLCSGPAGCSDWAGARRAVWAAIWANVAASSGVCTW